jgi:hypothetical protein
MTSEVVFKPVEKLPKSYQGYIEPPKYFPTYIEWLYKNSVKKNFYDFQDAIGGDQTYTELVIPKTDVLFITSVTIGALFDSLVPIAGLVYLQMQTSKEMLALLEVNNVSNAAVPVVTTKTFNPPLMIKGSETINFVVWENLRGYFDVEGFIVPQSII